MALTKKERGPWHSQVTKSCKSSCGVHCVVSSIATYPIYLSICRLILFLNVNHWGIAEKAEHEPRLLGEGNVQDKRRRTSGEVNTINYVDADVQIDHTIRRITYCWFDLIWIDSDQDSGGDGERTSYVRWITRRFGICICISISSRKWWREQRVLHVSVLLAKP